MQERRRFSFLLEPLSRVAAERVPCDVEGILSGLDPSVLPDVAELLIAEWQSLRLESLPAFGRKLVRLMEDQEAGLRHVREAMRVLKGAGVAAVVQALLAEARRGIELSLLSLRPQANAYRAQAKRGAPPRATAQRQARLRRYGLSRDDARDLLRTIPIADSAPPRQAPPSKPGRFTQPTLLDVIQGAVDDGRLVLKPRPAKK